MLQSRALLLIFQAHFSRHSRRRRPHRRIYACSNN
jgi:hypothetical protein